MRDLSHAPLAYARVNSRTLAGGQNWRTNVFWTVVSFSTFNLHVFFLSLLHVFFYHIYGRYNLGYHSHL